MMKLFKTFTCYLLFSLIIVAPILAQEKRDLLQHRAGVIESGALLSATFKPFATYKERSFWDSIAQPTRAEFIKAGEQSLAYRYGSVPLTTYLNYKRTGNRTTNEEHYRDRRDNLRNLILAEVVEGEGRFMDAILDGTWSFLEQSSWAISAHLSLQKAGIGVPDYKEQIIDLTVGEVANLLSWSYYFFGEEFEAISPLINQRIRYEMEQRIFKPFLEGDNFWWLGFTPGQMVNNWNPWCNFNVLTAVLLVSDNPQLKEEILKKSLRSTDQFINYYKSDGGCEEGPSYWSHAAGKLLEYLELVDRATSGKVNIFDEPLIRRMGEYIALVHIGEEYYVNFADASALLKGVPDLIFRYGKSTHSKPLKSFGAYLAQHAASDRMLTGMLDQVLMKLAVWEEMKSYPAKPYAPSHFWLEGTEVVGVRSTEDSNEGFFFAAKGGYNEESHNHNDVGTFILYYNNDPILIDAGVGTYTAKTFSKERYDIWSMQSGFHNLPIINGVEQVNGKSYQSKDVRFKNGANKAHFSLDLVDAYPEEAEVETWVRSYEIDRKRGMTIGDKFRLKSAKKANQFVFLVANGVEELSPGKLRLKGKRESLLFHFEVSQFNYETSEILLDDLRLSKVWGDKIYRLVLTQRHLVQTGEMQFRLERE